MVDLTKIPFGTKLVNKITGEVGVYNSMFTEPSYIIRVGDKQYQGTNNSPLIQEWEVYGDDWCLTTEIQRDDEYNTAFFDITDIKTLKQKILEDLAKEKVRIFKKYGVPAKSTLDILENTKEILDERFGF